MDVLKASVTELAKGLRSGQLCPVELLEAHIARIESVNGAVNGLVANRYDQARSEAQSAKDRLAAGGDNLPPLLGVPCTVKEFLPLDGMPYTGGILWRKGQRSDHDCTIVQRLKDAGAVIMGSSNVPEGGLWMETYNGIYGRSMNPWNRRHTPGGSSGGEGVLVSTGASPFGIGSDIGGSIRIPAAFCGVVGHKPTGGLVPTTGHFPDNDLGGASTYLVCGPLTRTVDDAWTVLKVIAGPDGQDLACTPYTLGNPDEVDLSELVVHVMETPGRVRVRGDVRAAVRESARALEEQGATLEKGGFKKMKHAFEIWAAMLAEGSPTPYVEVLGKGRAISVLWELLRWATGFGRHTFAALFMAIADRLASVMPGMRTKYVEVGKQLQAEIEEALGDNGVLLFPPYSRPAPRHWAAFLTPFDAQCTAVFNVLELPVTQVPAGFDENGLPLGVQVVAARGRDHLAIAAARAIEKTLGGWHQATPE